MATTLTPDLLDSFMDILSALSPENIMCDGERSAAAARRVAKALKVKWAVLEVAAGRKVSEDEVLLAWMNRSADRRIRHEIEDASIDALLDARRESY